MPTQAFAKSAARHFGIELRAARAKAGMTQQALAEQADIDPVFVSFLENGHRQPSLAVLLAIESALALTPGTLVLRTSKRVGSTVKKKALSGRSRSSKPSSL